MAPTVLTPDNKLSFPDFTLLRASAGSGKTRALAHRYIQFLLSDRIERNSLTSILAITFSNNAAREMKERILKWLKAIYSGDEEHLEILTYLTGLERETLRERAGLIVDHILDNYSDFQVRTIDSFTASIFRSSALEFGVSPRTEILLQKNELINQAFDTFFRQVRENTREASVLEKVIEYILTHKGPDTRYPWDPTEEIIDVFNKLYTRLASLPHDVKAEDYSAEMSETFEDIKEQIQKIDGFVTKSGLEYNRNARFDNALEAVYRNDRDYAIGRRHNASIIKKGKMKPDQFNEWNEQVNMLRDELNQLYAQLTLYYARSFYNPHLFNFRSFSDILNNVKRERNQILIDDIGKLLTSYLHEQVIPYVYLMLGDTIHHYLIDEFQDTSPLQWADLKPLIENSLSQGGSLFAVGDTKQAIYKFRGADFKIMKHLEENHEFMSASPNIVDLDTNYRSDGNILRFNETFFNAIREHDEYGAAARLSGLDHHKQQAAEGKQEKGYAESIVFSPDMRDEEPHPEQKKILDTIKDALRRGYSHRDIAVLTLKNNDVTTISSWLSEERIPFVSFSNLDVRNRKITGEIISLLQFLNSPVDDLSFASFCLGDICGKVFQQNGISRDEFIQHITQARNESELRKHPLYKNVMQAYPDFWQNYLEHLFNRVGHLSIYDLTLDIYKTFSLYQTFNDEEGTLTKFIEAMKDFESTGTNSLHAFLDHVDAEDSESLWNIDTPEKIDAVQLMTIHKAKGLGFPVVLVVLYNDHRMKEDFYIDMSNNPPNLMYIRKNFADVSPSIENVYNEHRLASIADFLNGIYVACTRAENELYLIGVPPKNIGKTSIFSFFPGETFGEMEQHLQRNPSEEKYISAYHHTHPAHFGFGDDMPLNISDLQRGELIHEILSSIEFIDDTVEEKIQNELDRYKQRKGAALDLPDKYIVETISSFLKSDEIYRYFEKLNGRIIQTETDITDASGTLFRVDRLVIDTEHITAIDFKTGDDHKQTITHEKQLRNYMTILRDIYPGKTVHGIVAYIDKKNIKVVE